MKKFLSIFLSIIVVLAFAMFAVASTDSEDSDQGSGTVDSVDADNSTLGLYQVEIMSCRLAKDYEGDAVVIVKYNFTNNAEEATSFYVTFDDAVYQNGVGLNSAYVLDDSANYNADNQTKDIKKGTSIEVEVAYELNDTTSDIEVEVEELFSFDDKKLTKTFKIAE